MERCGFFDANLVGEEYDRVYLSQHFAAYFASFIGNGVFSGKSNELQVMALSAPQMKISVLSGQGYINGYWYENTDSLFLSVDNADGVLNRIDSVVLKIGYAERDMWLAVKKGTPAISPTAPSLTRNADYYELGLANIYVGKGAIGINQGNIEDTRFNAELCGIVHGLVKQVDITTLYNQYSQGFKLKKEEFEQEFMLWFTNLQELLDENTAGNLFNLINTTNSDLEALQIEVATHKASADNFNEELTSQLQKVRNDKENKATYTKYTMPAWDSTTFTDLETKYPSYAYNLEIQLSNSCTSDEIDAWNDAQILGSITDNNLYSKGDYPTISIPTYLKIIFKK